MGLSQRVLNRYADTSDSVSYCTSRGEPLPLRVRVARLNHTTVGYLLQHPVTDNWLGIPHRDYSGVPSENLTSVAVVTNRGQAAEACAPYMKKPDVWHETCGEAFADMLSQVIGRNEID